MKERGVMAEKREWRVVDKRGQITIHEDESAAFAECLEYETDPLYADDRPHRVESRVVGVWQAAETEGIVVAQEGEQTP